MRMSPNFIQESFTAAKEKEKKKKKKNPFEEKYSGIGE